MSYKVLYRKYRPSDFDNIVGQEYTINMLKKAICSGKTAHAYIFSGPRGTGKTSTAKLFAKALNCENNTDGNPCGKCDSCLNFKDNPDIIEIDAASNNGVEEIRELINNVKLVPSNSKYKIYIIDEVHMLSTSAFNALLLTLEEPPSHVVFILATTDIQNVPITILSRCQRFDFKPISQKVIFERLKFVSEQEHINIEDDAINEIALLSAGGMRDALGMLDQLSSNDEKITLERVSSYFGSVSSKSINEVLKCIYSNNAEKLLDSLNVVRNSGTSYTVFIEKMIIELRKECINIKLGISEYSIGYETLLNLIFDLNECLNNININVDPYTLIELLLLKYINVPNVLGNNLGNKSKNDLRNKNDLGNKIVEIQEKSDVLGNNDKSGENVIDSLEKSKIESGSKVKTEVINNDFVLKRINNCFVAASKKDKELIASKWVEFMNYLMDKNRDIISLIADTTVLAASNNYLLIQSKIDSTNALINSDINKIDKLFSDFMGNSYRIAAINEDLWKKEVEKYRFNLKNKIKYSYIDEDLTSESDEVENNASSNEDIVDLGNNIFGDVLEVE